VDNNIKVTIDQLYEYLKSLNENEEPNTDKINLDELLDNIDNQDIILILDHDMSEEEIVQNVFESCFDVFRCSFSKFFLLFL
jgi:hypothetical protein